MKIWIGIGVLIMIVLGIVFFGNDESNVSDDAMKGSLENQNQVAPNGFKNDGGRMQQNMDNRSMDFPDEGRMPERDMNRTPREFPQDDEMMMYEDTESCEGLSEGDSCTTTNPEGDSMEGICQMNREGNLACRPEMPEGEMPMGEPPIN
jgi:hypothetical protein